MLTWNGQRVQAFEGRETAPAGAREDQFLDAQGQPLPLQQAVVGGRAVATPGVVRMLEMAHAQQGKLPWARLFEQQWGLNVQEAINLPNFVQVMGPIWMEKGRYTPEFLQQLKDRGHRIE
jgi:gamma-glutamyltranspeptidase